VTDPLLGLAADVRLVHPFEASKRYRCPACGHAIERDTGHYVVVPQEAPDLRRHWGTDRAWSEGGGAVLWGADVAARA